MRFVLLTLVLSLFLVAGVCVKASQAVQMGIAVVVNEDAISVDDLNARMDLIIASSRLPNTEKTRQQLAPQVVNSLIDEQLKLQEAERLEIEVTRPEIDEGFGIIAQQNGFEPAQFRQVLQQSGINISTMERQIESQLAWTKVIQKSMRPKVTISDNDIDNVLERMKDNSGSSEYLLAEIFLPVENSEEEMQIRGLAQELTTKARAEKGSFFRLAQQFSRAPGAPKGGDIGWVPSSQLPEELAKAVSSMKKGDISAPVRTVAGYHILSLRDERVISEDTIPSRKEIENSLGVERLERMQKRHMLDLKSSAFIENRLVQQ